MIIPNCSLKPNEATISDFVSQKPQAQDFNTRSLGCGNSGGKKKLIVKRGVKTNKNNSFHQV